MSTKATPGIENTQIQLPHQTLSFDQEAFDLAVRSQGVEMVHWRALPCPVGLIDAVDVSRPHEDHEGCSNGFIYIKAGVVTVTFTGNSLQARAMDAGRMDASTVAVTFPRFYDSTDDGCCDPTNPTPILVAPYDRFYLKEDEMLDSAKLEVIHWQRNQASQTGIDKMSFPIMRVMDVVDSTGKRYYYEDDFVISNGNLKWLKGGPGFDSQTNRGLVYSIRFVYKPYWYVERMQHEIRVAQVIDPVTGERKVERMPQSAILQREYNFLSFGSDPNPESAPASNSAQARQPRPPVTGFGSGFQSGGGFSPR